MVRYERTGAAAVVTIARPERRNAVDGPTAEKLGDAYDRFVADDDARVLVLTGEGPHAFCSGGDQKARGAEGYVDDEEMGRGGPGRFDVTALHL